MTVHTGTATDYLDLLSKIATHLVADGWTLMGSGTVGGETQKYFKGPGLAGDDEIYVNISAYAQPVNDLYNFRVRGAIAYNPLLTFENQPGSSPDSHILLWQSEIPYTLIVNGRRFILDAKISTTYSTLYAGFLLPYATSAEMPYPMYIGGMSATAQRWSRTGWTVGACYDPCQNSSWLRHFDGAWISVENYYESNNSRAEIANTNIWPYAQDFGIHVNEDGDYSLLSCIVHSNYSGGNVYGELDGIRYITGFSNAVENTVTVDSDTYLVIQSGPRTSRRDYAAILLS